MFSWTKAGFAYFLATERKKKPSEFPTRREGGSNLCFSISIGSKILDSYTFITCKRINQNLTSSLTILNGRDGPCYQYWTSPCAWFPSQPVPIRTQESSTHRSDIPIHLQPPCPLSCYPMPTAVVTSFVLTAKLHPSLDVKYPDAAFALSLSFT